MSSRLFIMYVCHSCSFILLNWSAFTSPVPNHADFSSKLVEGSLAKFGTNAVKIFDLVISHRCEKRKKNLQANSVSNFNWKRHSKEHSQSLKINENFLLHWFYVSRSHAVTRQGIAAVFKFSSNWTYTYITDKTRHCIFRFNISNIFWTMIITKIHWTLLILSCTNPSYRLLRNRHE